MEIKLIEIRDSATFIPAIAIKMGANDSAEHYLLSRSGYGTTNEDMSKYVFLARLQEMQFQYETFMWGDARTMPVIHEYLQKRWEDVESGQVLDVQYILMENPQPKVSEREEGMFHP